MIAIDRTAELHLNIVLKCLFLFWIHYR